ncbi:hypothetical protein M514_15547, partial [Trichuris suis]
MQSFRVFEFFSTLESSVFMPALPTHEWTGSDLKCLMVKGADRMIVIRATMLKYQTLLSLVLW